MAEFAPLQHTAPAAAAPVVQRKCDSCEAEDEESVQRWADGPAAVGRAPGAVAAAAASPGRALDAASRSFFEGRLGRDFSDVRVHTDVAASSAARSIGARAYTLGRDIVFGAGGYAPASAGGRRLLAHELAHVVQQDPSAGRAIDGPLELGPPDSAAEAEADRVAEGL